MTRLLTLMDGIAASLKDAAISFESGSHWRAALLWPDPESQFSPFTTHSAPVCTSAV